VPLLLGHPGFDRFSHRAALLIQLGHGLRLFYGRLPGAGFEIIPLLFKLVGLFKLYHIFSVNWCQKSAKM
jgi:hypothetical protein